MIKIKHRTNQRYEREDDDDASYHLINNKDAIGIKLAPDLVDEPRKPKPPQQGSEDNAQITDTHLKRHIRHHKSKLRKGCHEKEHNERIGERDQERRKTIMEQRALLVAALVHILHRVALETIYPEHQQQDASEYLEIELVLGIVDEIHHKAHAETRQQGIHDVAASGSYTSDKTIPTPLVQSALDT